MDKGFTTHRLDNIIYDNIVILVIAVLVAFQVMTALFMYYITGPIERLNVLINLQARGDFSKYIMDPGRDSVGKVARYLSRFAKQINDRFQGEA